MTTPNSIQPTELDIGGSGLGAYVTEGVWRGILAARGIGNGSGVNFVVGGLDLNGVDGSLVATFNAGTAIIDGLLVSWPQDTIQLVDNSWQYVYLQVDESGGLASGGNLNLETGTTVPPRSVLLRGFRVASGAVQDHWDRRPQSANGHHGTASGDDVPAQIVLGFNPTLVFFKHADGSFSIVAASVGATRLIDSGDLTTPTIQSYGISYKALQVAESIAWYAIG